MAAVYVTESCNGGVGKDKYDVAVAGVDYKALLRYLVRISIAINPSCEPRVPGVQYDGTVMPSSLARGYIDILRANIKNPGVSRPPTML